MHSHASKDISPVKTGVHHRQMSYVSHPPINRNGTTLATIATMIGNIF